MTHATLPVLACVFLAACAGDKSDTEGSQTHDPVTDCIASGPDPFTNVVPTWTGVEEEFEGWPFVYHLPQDMVALAFVFHPGTWDYSWVYGTEQTDTINLLSANGIGFVATSSQERDGLVEWDIDELSPEDNPDIKRNLDLRDWLIENTEVTEDLPLFAWGFSRGSTFTSLFGHVLDAEGLPIRALALYNSTIGGTVRSQGGLKLPTIFAASENDEQIPSEEVLEDYQDLKRAGIDAEINLTEEGTMVPERFLRIKEVVEDDTSQIFDALVTTGVIDSEGDRAIEDIYEAVVALQGLDQALPTELAYLSHLVNWQTEVVWAAHQFNADWCGDHREFFLDHL